MLEAQQMPMPRCLSVAIPHQDGEGFGAWCFLWLWLSQRCAGHEAVPRLKWRQTVSHVFGCHPRSHYAPSMPPRGSAWLRAGGYGGAATVSLFALPFP